jgi:hypothetical protein
MALYTKSNPEQNLRREVDAARISRDAVAKRLAAAQDKVTECEATLQRLAREGAQDPVLVAAEIALDTAERRVSTLQPALAEAETLLMLLESQLAETLDKTARNKTASECEQMALDLETIAQEIDPILQRMIAVTGRAFAGEIWDSNGLHIYATSSKMQIPLAVEMLAQAMREHSVRVLDGRARATLLTPAAPRAAVETTPAEPTTGSSGIYTYHTPNSNGPSFVTPNAFAKEKF